MHTFMKRAAALVAVSALLLVAGCAGAKAPSTGAASGGETSATANPEVLTISIAGMVTPKEGLEYYKGLSEYIGRRVGRPVRLIHKAEYAEVNHLLKDEKLDLAFVCSGPYATGHDEFGLKLVAAPVVNGQPAYFSYIIAPKSSEATSLASLKGSVFAFADPQSNTGCLVPTYMLSTMGETPETFFKETFFTYSHDNSIKAVANGEADGAAVDSLIWDYESATDPAFTSKTRIVQRSEPFAIPPVVARAGLDATLTAAIRQAFLSAHKDAEGKAILDKMKIERFVTIDDSAYDSIRRMSERVKK
jgi:phosphonate transport system substrate-binding protein